MVRSPLHASERLTRIVHAAWHVLAIGGIWFAILVPRTAIPLHRELWADIGADLPQFTRFWVGLASSTPALSIPLLATLWVAYGLVRKSPHALHISSAVLFIGFLYLGATLVAVTLTYVCGCVVL